MSDPAITGENAAAVSHELRRVKAARINGWCRDGLCRYNVPPTEPAKHSDGTMCDGWRGVEYQEPSGAMFRFRPCDRALAWNRARRAKADE